MYLASGPPFSRERKPGFNWCLQAKSVIQLALSAESGRRTLETRLCSSIVGYTEIIVGRVRESWQLLAEHLLNFRLQMRVFRCNCEVSNANKTNENWSVQTDRGELENRCD